MSARLQDHNHGHGHGHDHVHGDAKGRAFAVGVTLNLAFVAVEAGFGLWADSLSLLADAGHNFSDVLGLLAAWWAVNLARRLPSMRFTYGLRASTIVAAFANAVLLIVAVGGISWEALRRLAEPVPVGELTMISVALVGVVINLATAFMLSKGRHDDMNMRGAYLHMVADAAVSVGVAVAGVGIILTGWLWLDPVLSLAIGAVILVGTWSLFRESLRLSLHAVPAGIDAAMVMAYLQQLPGVREVHDLHVWGMSTTETALTAHLVMTSGHPGDEFLRRVAGELEAKFRIGHPTLQIELADGSGACRFAPGEVV
ncbi:MAG: cation transporter [Chromatiales bacterium]|nr:cation transporter [Chromatiales bacterium]